MKKSHGHDLRKGRFSEPNRIYLITAVTQARAPWFQNLGLGRLLVGVLRAETPHAETLAYVVMPDHLHWLMQLREEHTLSRVIEDVKSISAHRINRALERTGPLWQAGFHDHALRHEEDVASVARYVVANPLRAGLVKSLGDYPLWDAAWI
ncbi:MAG: transposase [Sulfuricella sp.]|nr:transposase [Sulfuricella sp.]